MSVANSYAQALFEAANGSTKQEESAEQLEKNLEQMLSVIESSREIKVAFLSPLTTLAEKKACLEGLSNRLGFPTLMTQFFMLLMKKNRLVLLDKIKNSFHETRLFSEGGMTGTLTTAEPISNQDIDVLTKAFAQKFGKRVSFEVNTDPSVVAGIKVTVNGVTYDGTLRSQLEKLRDRMAAGMNGAHTS
jgi:F-type H+-transporting ATPase subunit delta